MANTSGLQIEKFEERDPLLELHLNERLLDPIDAALGLQIDISLAGLAAGDYDLTPTQARYNTLRFHGNPAGAQVVRIPSNAAATKGAIADPHVVNDCGGSFSTLTIKSRGANAGNAAGVTVQPGKERTVRHDQESVYPKGAEIVKGTGTLPSPGFSGARVYSGSNQTLTTGVNTALNFNAERYDVGGYHDNVTNNTRLTAPVAGYYRLTGHVQIAASGAGTRAVTFRINGVTFVGYENEVTPVAGTAVVLGTATTYQMAAGSYAELIAFQDSGGNLDVLTNGDVSPAFMMELVGV